MLLLLISCMDTLSLLKQFVIALSVKLGCKLRSITKSQVKLFHFSFTISHPYHRNINKIKKLNWVLR